jgi:TRAP transporter TAXI family solute receptor
MRIALALGLCILAGSAATLLAAPAATTTAATTTENTAKAPPAAKKKQVSQPSREAYRTRMNENVVTIMAGSSSGTDLAIVQDIADVLDDGDALRVVPMVGKGPAQNVKDVVFLRGVDMGVTQANILKHFAQTGEISPNLTSQIAYVAKLFNEEMHILVRSDVDDIRALAGKPVNFGASGSGTEITSRLIFEALGIGVQARHLPETEAIEQLKAGEIDAAIVVTGKPAPVLAALRDTKGLKLLAVPYAKQLEADYYPGTLTHEDYPALVPEGASVDTVAVCAVLVSFNWNGDHVRQRKIAKFIDRFFNKFDALTKSPHHPKWQEVNFAATLENWQRSPIAQKWIDRAKASTTTATADSGTRRSFDTFLAQSAPTGTPISEEERAVLFKAFLEWSKTQTRN